VGKKFTSFIVVSLLLLGIYPFPASAASSLSVFKAKYPKQTIRVSQNVDLDKDRKPETVILTKQGNLFLVKGNTVSVVAKDIISDDGMPAPKLTVFNPAKGEYQVITRYFYYPSNTQASVYRIQKGKLVRVLNVMGDVDIRISKGKIYQDWKKYRNEGGWDRVTAVYSWSSTSQKFVVTGVKP
jgi:hypothetical protein